MLEQIVVDVPHQVEMAFLLVASHRIISSVEVRNQDAREITKRLLEDGSFSGRMIEVDDDLRARECLDVADRSSLDADLCLVGVDEHPGSKQVQHLVVSSGK